MQLTSLIVSGDANISDGLTAASGTLNVNADTVNFDSGITMSSANSGSTTVHDVVFQCAGGTTGSSGEGNLTVTCGSLHLDSASLTVDNSVGGENSSINLKTQSLIIDVGKPSGTSLSGTYAGGMTVNGLLSCEYAQFSHMEIPAYNPTANHLKVHGKFSWTHPSHHHNWSSFQAQRVMS